MTDNDPDTDAAFDSLTSRVQATRAELFDTLDAIEDKLNLPKQLGKVGHRAKQAFDEHPTPILAAFAGGVLTVGGIVVSVIRRR